MNTTILTKREIKQTLLSHQNTLSEHGVKRLGLFGSYVKDTAHDGSDIDLLVELEKCHLTGIWNSVFFLKIYCKRRLTSSSQIRSNPACDLTSTRKLSMSQDFDIYLEDILEAIDRIQFEKSIQVLPGGRLLG